MCWDTGGGWKTHNIFSLRCFRWLIERIAELELQWLHLCCSSNIILQGTKPKLYYFSNFYFILYYLYCVSTWQSWNTDLGAARRQRHFGKETAGDSSSMRVQGVQQFGNIFFMKLHIHTVSICWFSRRQRITVKELRHILSCWLR